MTAISGAAPLSAATVVGDLLGRTGLACTWLTLTDAAAVTIGGLPALREAIASGVLTPAATDGVDLVRPGVAARRRAADRARRAARPGRHHPAR